MHQLQSALDREVQIIVQGFAESGIRLDVDSIYGTIQRSNSSLKRKPKRVLHSSIERVLDFLNLDELNGHDSDAEIEKKQSRTSPDGNIMNRGLRAALVAPVAETPIPEVVLANPAAISDESTRKRRLPNGEPAWKRQRSDKIDLAPPSDLSLDDIGGMDDVMKQLEELLILPLEQPGIYRDLKAPLPRGILLHGPPGCGKTMIARAFAAELELPFIEILGPSLVSSMSGDSEKAVRERFDEAKKNAPCLLFIDELDAIAPKRDTSQSQMEKRIVAQLLVSMDELGRDYDRPVMVLAATNRPDSLDPALRRGGRFDTEININVPTEQVREQILRAQTRETPISPDLDFRRLAKLTAGFVGADLHDLVGKAVSRHLRRYRAALKSEAQTFGPEIAQGVVANGRESRSSNKTVQELRAFLKRVRMKDAPSPLGFDRPVISLDDFLDVLPGIVPSSKREGFATVPDVSWDDIGALQSVRKKLQTAIVEPIQQPELHQAFGMKSSNGILLWGPPGCGKTLLAKAAAAESKANFISVKGPELVDKFVGESEAALRKLFARARSSMPCVIFFDEIDALAPKRSASGESGFASRIVGTLLTELDGLSDRAGIYVIGATNRPDMMDDALLRPGRLGRPIFVGFPGADGRVEILRTLLRGKPVDHIPEILEIARQCEGFTGADLDALLSEAVQTAISRKSSRVNAGDFQSARESMSGSITDTRQLDALKKKFGGQ